MDILESKQNNVVVSVVPTKLAKSAAVMVAVDFPHGCYFTLKGLCCGTSMCTDSPYSSAFLHAVFGYISDKLRHTFADELNSQVTNLNCNLQNGQFVVIASCTGTISAIRRAIVGILKGFNPAKMYPGYKNALIKLSEECEERLSADREIFNHFASVMAKHLKSKVNVLICGKALMNKEKLDLLTQSVAAKLNVSEVDGKKTDPKETKHKAEGCLVKSKGFNAVLTKRYLESELKDNLHLVDGCLYGPDKYSKHVEKLADEAHIKRHVGTKYAKFKEDLSHALVFLAVLNNLVDCSTALQYAKSKVTGSSIVNGIKSSL